MSADLAEPYREMEGKLKDAVAKLLRRGNHQLLSAMLHALLAYPDYPYDWKPIGYVDGKGGPNGRFVLVTTPPTLGQGHALAQGAEAAGDPGRGEGPGPAVLGVLRLHQHPSGLGAAGEDHPGRRVHGQGARCRQGSHPKPQCMDRQERPRRGRDYLPSAAGADRADALRRDGRPQLPVA